MNVNILEAGVWSPFPGRAGEGSSGVEEKGNKKFPNLQIWKFFSTSTWTIFEICWLCKSALRSPTSGEAFNQSTSSGWTKYFEILFFFSFKSGVLHGMLWKSFLGVPDDSRDCKTRGGGRGTRRTKKDSNRRKEMKKQTVHSFLRFFPFRYPVRLLLALGCQMTWEMSGNLFSCLPSSSSASLMPNDAVRWFSRARLHETRLLSYNFSCVKRDLIHVKSDCHRMNLQSRARARQERRENTFSWMTPHRYSYVPAFCIINTWQSGEKGMRWSLFSCCEASQWTFSEGCCVFGVDKGRTTFSSLAFSPLGRRQTLKKLSSIVGELLATRSAHNPATLRVLFSLLEIKSTEPIMNFYIFICEWKV